MLTTEGSAARRRELWKRVPERIEWLLVADPRHVQYLCNFWVNPLSFSGGERAILLLERTAGATLLADNFTLLAATGKPDVDREIIEEWYDHKHAVINRDQALLNAVKTLADRLYGRVGAIEAEWFPLGAWEVLGLDRETHTLRPSGNSGGGDSVDLGTLLRELRRQKHPDEIALMNRCMRAGEAGMARAREVIRPGVTEWDVYRAVHAAALEAAGRPIQIYGDFRATNAENPKAGGPPTGYTCRAGDLFIVDYSVVIDAYRSDFTNTFAVGAPSDEQQMLFRLCEAAMKAGEQKLRTGTPARDVFAAVDGVFISAGYSDFFKHHAGHGIGMAHPEPPILVPDSTDYLLAGDVVTLEPGLYVQGIGGMRIEHNYLVTDLGPERLSQHVISLT
jgi:Xaa-Pro aminopeptidase